MTIARRSSHTEPIGRWRARADLNMRVEMINCACSALEYHHIGIQYISTQSLGLC